MQKLIIDTDPGQDIDDLLALAFALQRPELNILAITTVTWPTEKRARLVKRLLRYLDRTGIPVGAGLQFPLRPFSEVEIREQYNLARTMNHYAFAEPEDPRDRPDTTDAGGLIIHTVEHHPGEVILACLGPLTNIACALRRAPHIADKIQRIALMGGEVALNRREHNIAFDDIAADIVLSSGIPIVMGTWSVTGRLTLSPEDCEAFRTHCSPLCRALGQAISLWFQCANQKPSPVLYDLFPLVHSFTSDYYTTTPLSVSVETKGELTRGMTVASGNATNIEVTTDIRTRALRKLYLDTVLTGQVNPSSTGTGTG